MKLLIHDLSDEQFQKFRTEYSDWHIISDNGLIRPCIGCFSCWNRTPGKCVVKDGYDDMGYLVHQAEEIRIISRYTYGGFSGFVKNVIDRCLGYVLPQFEITEGETHHQKRYDEDKPFTFIFYGEKLNDQQKRDAERYVKAMCMNFRCHVREVFFEETEDDYVPEKRTLPEGGKTVLLVGSMRNNGNSSKFADELNKMLDNQAEKIFISRYLNNLDLLVEELSKVRNIVLCMPLYVDGLPSQVIRLFEIFEKKYEGSGKKIYVLTNMGLYEKQQLVNLFTAVSLWSRKMGFEYGGGLGMTAGELIGVLIQKIPFRIGPSSRMEKGMRKLADAIRSDKTIVDIYEEPHHFPRSLYIMIANKSWNIQARKNGIDPKDLYRKL